MAAWHEPPRDERPHAQPYRVTLNDGTVRDVCCGPAVAALAGVTHLLPLGGPREGLCCQNDVIVRAEVLRTHAEAVELEQVYRALAPWKFNNREGGSMIDRRIGTHYMAEDLEEDANGDGAWFAPEVEHELAQLGSTLAAWQSFAAFLHARGEA